MPKVSKATASSHEVFAGYTETYEQEIDGWTVTMESHLADFDGAPFFKGGPNDQCQGTHMGYMLKGKMCVRREDGVEETFEAGDAYIIEPGHTPIMFAGCEFVNFTRTEDVKKQLAVVMPNVLRFAAEHGVDLPGQETPS